MFYSDFLPTKGKKKGEPYDSPSRYLSILFTTTYG